MDDKATQLHAIASLKVLLDGEGKSPDGPAPSDSVTQMEPTSSANGEPGAETHAPNNVSYTTRAIRRISYKAAQGNDQILSIPEIDGVASPAVSTVSRVYTRGAPSVLLHFRTALYPP